MSESPAPRPASDTRHPVGLYRPSALRVPYFEDRTPLAETTRTGSHPQA